MTKNLQLKRNLELLEMKECVRTDRWTDFAICERRVRVELGGRLTPREKDAIQTIIERRSR